ncbi:MAG: ANTAR domain-containing response regulator [Gammaproteobacteria bacterium]
MSTKLLLFNNTSLDETEDIRKGLNSSSYEIVLSCSDLTKVSSAVMTNSVDMMIVVINKQFEELLVFVRQIIQNKPMPIVVFTNTDDKEVINSAIKVGVSAFIVDGLQAKRMVSILDTAKFRFKEQHAVKMELKKAKDTLSERKLIEKAKGIVMQRSEIDEDDAYKAMRKMAMDKNMKIVDLAKSVISATELMR